VVVDSDVQQADGGTRTAAITGGYVALALALGKLVAQGELPAQVLRQQVAAVSVGIVAGDALLDLCYTEDSHAETDMNVVMTGSGELIELQGTAEREPFSRQRLDELLVLAQRGITQLMQLQREAL